MASHAPRRIALSCRSFGALLLCTMATMARAGWENTHFCKLAEDRLVILAGKDKFMLTHGAAWELVDAAQKPAFDAWVAKSKLPKDVGQLVADKPADHELPLAAEFDFSPAIDGKVSVAFKHNNTIPKTLTLAIKGEEAKLDADSEKVFIDIAKDLSKVPSTLLVLLSDKGGAISDGKAWAAVLNRLKAKPSFTINLDKKQGLLWVRVAEPTSAGDPVAPTNSTKPEPTDTGNGDEKKTVADDKKSGSSDPIPLVATGIVMLLVGGAGGYILKSRASSPTKAKASTKSPVDAADRFKVSANERELVEKVRDEIRRLGWDANHIPSGDEFIVGQMIDRYNRSDSLTKDLEKLEKYRKFKEDHDSFQKQIDVAVARANASATETESLKEQLKREGEKSNRLGDELKKTQSQLASSQTDVRNAQQRIQQLERSDAEFQQVYSELVNRTATICHDIVLTRPRGDAWALAFAYLVDYTLSNIGLARQCNDQKMFDAMLTNLARLSEAMAKAFPDRKLVVDPWRRAVKAFGDVTPPAYDAKPHPHVDSLSQIMLTVRDTGPSLSDFRELYAPSESGLHIIRPA